jgi:hypothetical protein
MRRSVGVAMVAGALASTLVTASSAFAATNPYTPTGVCGSGYSVIESKSATYVTVYLLWNGSTQRNCVVALKAGAAVGNPHTMNAYVEDEDAVFDSDPGSYSYYAGPVYVHAPGQCVLFGGWVIYNGSWWGGEDISWDHCA